MKTDKIKYLGLILILGILGLGIFYKKEPKAKIMVDLGHGGKDPGTTSLSGRFEKDINLEIGKLLKKEFRFKGYKLYFTRESDIYIDPDSRARKANELGVDLFISLHCNAMENNSEIKGLQVLYYPSGDNEEISNIMMESIINETGGENKGVVDREKIIVLKNTKMKSLLIEMGFISNEYEARKLEDKDYQRLMVRGIYKGIENIYKEGYLD